MYYPSTIKTEFTFDDGKISIRVLSRDEAYGEEYDFINLMEILKTNPSFLFERIIDMQEAINNRLIKDKI